MYLSLHFNVISEVIDFTTSPRLCNIPLIITIEEIENKTMEICISDAAKHDQGEIPKTENRYEAEIKKLESDDESSPRGVLEQPESSSDSDHTSTHSSNSSTSFGGDKSPGDKLNVLEATYSGLQWKKFIGQITKRPYMRFATLPLLGGYGPELTTKYLWKKLGRNHGELETIECGDFAVPKPSWRNFTYEELKKATENFGAENLIGKGGQAEVYKGYLQDNQLVAVKKIMKERKKDEDKVGCFLAELGIIAHIDHPNSAKLIGFSADCGLHLVLKYCPQGSLASALHGSEQSMDWQRRYKIALGIAEGLKYLHYNCQRRIVHRDITASNILLSEDYEPQISDFGLAKWLPEKWAQHIVSPIEGTFGYMAPEYFMHGIVNEKIDVFAFGVLLLELITGCRSVDSRRQSLVIWAKPLLDQNNVKDLVDPRLGEDYDITEMKQAMHAASMCIHHFPSMRPNMIRVLQLLKGEKETGPDIKHKSLGMKSMFWDSYDMEEYSSTAYMNDLNRHKELVMEHS